MAHDTRNWRRKWTWDAATRTATHISGVVVRFQPKGGGVWDGEAVDLTPLHGLDPRRIARLMREAGDVATEYLGSPNERA